MACYFVVFKLLLKQGGPGYVYFLLVGLVPWLWFARTINQATNSLMAGRGLMGQLYLPKTFFPSVIIVQTTLKQILIIVTLIVFLYASSKMTISGNLLYLPLLIVSQISIMIPASMMAALLVVYINDSKYVIPTAIQFLFFFSGIFYDIGNIDPPYSQAVLINPMAGIVQAYRDILLNNTAPNYSYLLSVLATGTFLSLVSMALYKKLDHKIARLVQE